MTLPLVGHPLGARDIHGKKDKPAPEPPAIDPLDKIESAYRFLLADLMPFGRRAVIGLEHGGNNNSKEHYESVTYWYGLPAPSLVLTDTLKIGDAESEKKHAYDSPQASAPEEITSRYELGVDHVAKVETYPAHTDTGRVTKGTSTFTLAIDKENLGVMLRRKLDYSYPNQRAKVFVADASPTAQGKEPQWREAGIWYLAGSNTCVYSFPGPELGDAQHNAQTSNRRFRDDEFLIARELTEGRSALRVKVEFTPVDRPLFPGRAVDPLGWSEIKYDAYCFQLPKFVVPGKASGQ
jgi:hypothetical protein